jgi:hypothetical protein
MGLSFISFFEIFYHLLTSCSKKSSKIEPSWMSLTCNKVKMSQKKYLKFVH